MEALDRQMVFAVKEEILRNVAKTHALVLIEGWEGTGRTVTALKAVKGMGEVYYFDQSRNGVPQVQGISPDLDEITVLETSQALRELPPGKLQFVIFDDLNRTGDEARAVLTEMVKERVDGRSILVITLTTMNAQDLLEYMDAVVRVKQNTVEVMYSKLYNIGI